MNLRLKQILDSVRPAKNAEGDARFVAATVPEFSNHFVGWNNLGQPCVLLETTDIGFLAPLKLFALEVQFCIPCEVLLPNGNSEGHQLTVASCTTGDPDLRSYFLHLMDMVIQIVGGRPSLHDVSGAIGSLIEILQQLTKPASRSVAGLFAELLVIALSRDPLRCLSAWRANPGDRFDFSLDDARLETKATSDRVRSHYFSIEQCVPPAGAYAAVASIFVEQTGAGQSLGDLLSEVQGRLGGDMQAQLKLRAVAANSLGSSLPSALHMRFDSALARSTLCFFKAEDIPAIRPPVPGGVTAVRFRSDLTGIQPANIKQLAMTCPALANFLPS